MKKHIIILFSLIGMALPELSAQFYWTVPDEINPEEEVTIFVDVSQDPGCQKLVGITEDLYIWTWEPAALTGNGSFCGTWTSSAETAKVKHEGGDIYSITFIPTEFYGVDAATVYEKDISFLLKAKDGGSGADCSATGGEFKTSDIKVEVDPPVTGPRKVFSFPDKVKKDTLAISQSDIFTLIYDNKLEEKPSMIGVTDLYVYARAFTVNGANLRVSALKDVGNNPRLAMTSVGNGIFRFPFVPEMLFDVPAGDRIATLRLQIIRKNLATSSDAVDGEFLFELKCE